jgi:glycosyltransferase involved in cell wall biosynthesis
VPRRVEISLIVTCYNQRPLLELVLPSAVAQTVDAPYEILVCDDGSDDGALETIRASCGAAADVRYIWQPDRGFRASRSRNNAIRCAQGRLLVFVDADTWMSPAFLAGHLRAHRKGRTLACGARQTIVTDATGRALKRAVLAAARQPLRGEVDRQRTWLASQSPWMACFGGNFSVPRAARVRFDETFESWGSEDRDLAFRLWRAGFVPRLLDRNDAVHIRRPDEGLWHRRHEQVVALLRNKRRLRAKYPRGEMRWSLEVVRYCHLEPRTGRWSLGASRDASVDAVLAEFAAWEKALGSY